MCVCETNCGWYAGWKIHFITMVWIVELFQILFVYIQIIAFVLVDTHTRSRIYDTASIPHYSRSGFVRGGVFQGHPFYRYTNCCGMFYLCETTNNLAEPPFMLYVRCVLSCVCVFRSMLCVVIRTKHITGRSDWRRRNGYCDKGGRGCELHRIVQDERKLFVEHIEIPLLYTFFGFNSRTYRTVESKLSLTLFVYVR